MVLGYVAHGLRGDDDDVDDAEQVAALAGLLRTEHTVLPVQVLRSGAGVESDARDVRHAALEGEADRLGLRCVLHGHHADDQAETLLLRLGRGTGVDGLGAMAPVAGRRVRPLLDVRRSDLHRAAHGLLAEHRAEHGGAALGPAREDPMNADVDVARVRLRREVLPAFERVSPDPVGALTRLAALARDDSEVLDHLVDELRTSLPMVTFGRAALVPSMGLRGLPAALARRLVRLMLQHAGTTRPDAASVERVLVAPDGWRATLPGPVDVSVDRAHHIIVPVATPAGSGPARSGPARLDRAPGGTHVHVASGVRLTLRSAPGRLVAELPGGVLPGLDPSRLSVDLRPDHGAVHGAVLHVRTRRAGDRIRTPVGTRALGEILGEVGVPRAVRDLLPVVTGADDRPLWVPGVVVDPAVGGTLREAPRG